MSANLVTLQTCLAAMMGHPMSEEQLRQDVGLMVERLTRVIMMLQRLQLRMEEYVCLKVIAMVSQRKWCKCRNVSASVNDSMTFANSQRERQRGIGGHPRALHAVSAELRRTPLPPVAWTIH